MIAATSQNPNVSAGGAGACGICAGALECLVGHVCGQAMKPERQQHKTHGEKEFQGNLEWDFHVSSSEEQSFLTIYATEEKWDLLWPL